MVPSYPEREAHWRCQTAVARLAVLVIFLVSSTASAEKKCVVDKPVVAKARPVKPPPCNRASKAIEKSIADEIKKEYHPERSGKPEVTFPCDGLGAKIHEIVVETGGGHGGSLELWRAKRRTDGKYDARGIIYRGHA